MKKAPKDVQWNSKKSIRFNSKLNIRVLYEIDILHINKFWGRKGDGGGGGGGDCEKHVISNQMEKMFTYAHSISQQHIK